MSEGKNTDVRPVARQFVLSGWSDSIQPKDVYSDGTTNEPRGEEATQGGREWQQKVYKLSFSLIVEQVSDDGNQHVYKVLVNDDSDLLVSTYSKRSKKTTSSALAVPKKKSKGKSLALVYGVHPDGKCTLSHPTGQAGAILTAELYSWLLGQIDDVIQYRLQQQNKQTTDDDTGQRVESASTPTNVGGHQTRGRGKALRPKVRAEALPEEGAGMVETYGEILGERRGHIEDRLAGMGDVAGNREKH